jgi:hypothetical protein
LPGKSDLTEAGSYFVVIDRAARIAPAFDLIFNSQPWVNKSVGD